jgi:fermentation-respiration switch protein FrsA (DUF1100 family)
MGCRMNDPMPDRPVSRAAAAAAIVPPASYLTYSELLRSSFELTGLFLASPLLAASPVGDGHHVLVVPGFATNDHATLLLRSFLISRGYRVHAWDLGYNLDHRTVGKGGVKLLDRIAAIHRASGGRVSLVGWSLGGTLAREAARLVPDHVRQVVTLGSPFTGDPSANAVRRVYEWLTGNSVSSPEALERFAGGCAPLPVPSTSVFSRSDGIAPWQNCHARTDELTENVEVLASHFGMIANPAVFHLVADRLAQPEDAWAPFSAQGPFGLMYPRGTA